MAPLPFPPTCFFEASFHSFSWASDHRPLAVRYRANLVGGIGSTVDMETPWLEEVETW